MYLICFFVYLIVVYSSQTDAQYRNSILTFLLCMANAGNRQKSSGASSSSASIGRAIRSISTQNLNTPITSSTFYNDEFLSTTKHVSNIGKLNARSRPLTSSSVDINSKLSSNSAVQKSRSVGNFQSVGGNVTSVKLAASQVPTSVETIDDIVQNVIYAFTGVEGEFLKKDVTVGGFRLGPKARLLNVKHSSKALRLTEVAFYHDQVQSFTDASSGRNPLGLVGQGLVTAMRNELTLYYGMVAMLQEQLNRHRHSLNHRGKLNAGDKLTLHKIELWIREPSIRLQWMANIADACQEKKGGALATEIFRFKHNGNSKVKSLVHDLLVAACTPLQYMLSKWLLEGEINDPHSEFFIEVLPEVGTERLWNDKYRVRETMLPCFISKYVHSIQFDCVKVVIGFFPHRELAHKILVTGKSINFLKDICEEKTLIKGKKELKEYLATNGAYAREYICCFRCAGAVNAIFNYLFQLITFLPTFPTPNCTL